MNNSFILTFLASHWVDIVIVIAFIAIMIIAKKLIVKYDKSGKVKSIITALCIEAEKYLGSDTGKLKKEQVVIWFKVRYPWLSLFISDTQLNSLIDSIVEAINKYLTENNTTLDGLKTNINISQLDIIK